MAVLVRQTPGFELTGLSCDAFHKTYGIILAIELGFMPFMLAGPYFGSRHDNVHDYPILRESLGGCAHAPLRHCGTVTWVFTFSNRLTMATKLK